MSDIKWIKITTDMFDNRKIKHLRKLPEGNNIVLIWVMLLTMAGRCNSGGMIFLTENIPYTPKMLADELGFEENTIKLALQALEQLDMIIMDEEFFSVAGWDEHQNTEGLDKIREQNRIRKRNQRNRQKLLLEEKSHVKSRDSHTKSRDSHAADKDTDKDTDKDIDKDKDYIEIIDYLNLKAGTNYKASTKNTKSCIHARMQEGFTVEDFKKVIDIKCADWMGTEWEKFLRPQTLFGTKFESYLNEKVRKKPDQQQDDTYRNSEDVDLTGIYC